MCFGPKTRVHIYATFRLLNCSHPRLTLSASVRALGRQTVLECVKISSKWYRCARSATTLYSCRPRDHVKALVKITVFPIGGNGGSGEERAIKNVIAYQFAELWSFGRIKRSRKNSRVTRSLGRRDLEELQSTKMLSLGKDKIWNHMFTLNGAICIMSM